MKKWLIAIALVLVVCVAVVIVWTTAPVARNKYYSVRKDGNGYTLRFRTPPVRESLPEGVFVSYRSELYFSSLEEMKSKILTGDFTKGELGVISHMNMDDEGEMELFNLDNMYEPVMPEETPYKVRWFGRNYSIHFVSGHFSWGEDGEGCLERITKEQFDRGVDNLYDFPQIYDVRETPLQDRDGTCYEYERELFLGSVQVMIYRLTTDEKTMVVKEVYKIKDAEKELEQVRFYGEENGQYFYGRLHELKEPTDEWLLSFGIGPYTEP